MLAAGDYWYEVVANVGSNWASAKSAAERGAHHQRLGLLLNPDPNQADDRRGRLRADC